MPETPNWRSERANREGKGSFASMWVNGQCVYDPMADPEIRAKAITLDVIEALQRTVRAL